MGFFKRKRSRIEGSSEYQDYRTIQYPSSVSIASSFENETTVARRRNQYLSPAQNSNVDPLASTASLATFSSSQSHPPGLFNPPRPVPGINSSAYTYGSHIVPHRAAFEHAKAHPVKVAYKNSETGSEFYYEGFEGSRESYGAGKLIETLMDKDAKAVEDARKERALAAMLQDRERTRQKAIENVERGRERRKKANRDSYCPCAVM